MVEVKLQEGRRVRRCGHTCDSERKPLYVALLVLLGCMLFVFSPVARAQEDKQCAPETDLPMLEVFAQDSAGDDIAHSWMVNDGEWHTYSTGDPLGLEARGPLSRQPFKVAQCPPGVISKVVNNQVQLRPTNPAVQCPYESMHPSGHLYKAELPDGGMALLRLQPSAAEPAVVQVKVGGQLIEMQPASPIEIARIQLQGTEAQLDPASTLPEEYVTRQDLRSLVAFTDQKGQEAELLRAAQVVAELLANYYRRHGQFPVHLSQLTMGDTGVICSLPRNPYDWSFSLGAETAPYVLPGDIVYFPDPPAPVAGVANTTGYWLAVTGTNGTAQPAIALPEGVEAPAHVIRWIELHNTAAL